MPLDKMTINYPSTPKAPIPIKEIMHLLRKQEDQHEYISDSGLLQLPKPPVSSGSFRELDLSILLRSLATTFDRINKSKTPAISIAQRRPLPGPVAYMLTKLGQDVRARCHQFLKQGDERPEWVLDYTDHRFSPAVTVMLHAMKRWAFAINFLPNDSIIEPIDHEDHAAVTAINRLIAFIRRVGASRKFKNALHDYTRQANANYRSGCRFIYHLFARHTRLLVLRVDLYLRPGSQAWGSGEAAEAHAANFMRRLREGRIVPGYLGAIVKRENGIHRGMHWHWMIFMDGHRHQSACHHGQTIGDAWVNLIGTDQASYFNCYARRHGYRFNGLGVVNIDDHEKLLGVRLALHYLTKRDCVLRASSGKHQDFRRSKPRWRAKQGASRRDPNEIQHVKRALGGRRSRFPDWLQA